MHCPNCQSLIPDDATECGYCGKQFLIENYEQAHQQIPIDHYTNKPKTLVFNMIFAIMLILGGLASFNIPATLLNFNESAVENVGRLIFTVVIYSIPFVWNVFSAVVGVLLIMRKRIGYNCAIPMIWIDIVLSGLSSAACTLMIIFGMLGPGEYDALWAVVGTMFLIVALPTLIFYICSLRYYKKHKYYFTE